MTTRGWRWLAQLASATALLLVPGIALLASGNAVAGSLLTAAAVGLGLGALFRSREQPTSRPVRPPAPRQLDVWVAVWAGIAALALALAPVALSTAGVTAATAVGCVGLLAAYLAARVHELSTLLRALAEQLSPEMEPVLCGGRPPGVVGFFQRPCAIGGKAGRVLLARKVHGNEATFTEVDRVRSLNDLGTRVEADTREGKVVIVAVPPGCARELTGSF
jgi:hypothetical protein